MQTYITYICRSNRRRYFFEGSTQTIRLYCATFNSKHALKLDSKGISISMNSSAILINGRKATVTETTWPFDVSVFRKAPFLAVHTTPPSRRFQISPPWRSFSKSSVFGDRKRRFNVDGRPNRRKKDAFSNLSD